MPPPLPTLRDKGSSLAPEPPCRAEGPDASREPLLPASATSRHRPLGPRPSGVKKAPSRCSQKGFPGTCRGPAFKCLPSISYSITRPLGPCGLSLGLRFAACSQQHVAVRGLGLAPPFPIAPPPHLVLSLKAPQTPVLQHKSHPDNRKQLKTWLLSNTPGETRGVLPSSSPSSRTEPRVSHTIHRWRLVPAESLTPGPAIRAASQQDQSQASPPTNGSLVPPEGFTEPYVLLPLEERRQRSS